MIDLICGTIRFKKVIQNCIFFLAAVAGFLIGVWLSPQPQITSFLPTEAETDLYKNGINTSAFVLGVFTSIFAVIAGRILKISKINKICAVTLIGAFYIGIDSLRFGEFTLLNFNLLLMYLVGLVIVLSFEKLAMFILTQANKKKIH